MKENLHFTFDLNICWTLAAYKLIFKGEVKREAWDRILELHFETVMENINKHAGIIYNVR